MRDAVLPRHAQAHSIFASLTDGNWPDKIPAERPALLIANGLLAFLSQSETIALFNRVTGHSSPRYGTGE